MDKELVTREVGQFPLSIGTSLALEAVLGLHPNPPKQPAGYKSLQSLWINLRTLTRNLYQAMKADEAKNIKFINAVIVLLNEIQSIPQVLSNAGSSIKPVLYVEDMNEFKWLYPHAKLKVPKTDKQVHYKTYEDMVLAMLLEHLKEEKIPFTVVKRRPPAQHVQAMMLTHEPHQLLWKEAFDRLMLLESHTGKLKLYNNWYTKLNTNTDESVFPFNRYTLQVFGDGSLFDAQARNIKDELKQLASYKRWTGLTSYEKMRSDIFNVGSQALKKNYAELNP